MAGARGTIAAQDQRLLNSPLGMAGQRCMATLVFASGQAIAPERSEAALDAARSAIEASPLRLQAVATLPHPQVITLRVLAPVVEPATQLLRPVWAAWWQALWGLPGNVPRLWNL